MNLKHTPLQMNKSKEARPVAIKISILANTSESDTNEARVSHSPEDSRTINQS